MINIRDEAERCLQCKNPRCVKACPISTPIPQVIKIFLEGYIEEAGDLLFQNNPLSVICSIICPHEKFCEGNCIRAIKSTPIAIGAIEQYISNFYIHLFEPVIDKKFKGEVAVIGGGPAGMALSSLITQKGYNVTIFDEKSKIGGILRYGIPDFRLPNSILSMNEEKLKSMGVTIHPLTLAGPVLTISDMFRDGYDSVFISTGVWRPKKLGVKGETLGHVHYAINYLKDPDVFDLNDNVAVIGAGNVAMDVARTARRHGARNVTVFYHKGEEDLTASKLEIEYAKLDGVNFEFYSSVEEIRKNEIIYTDTRESNPKPKSFEINSVIISIGQVTQKNIVSTTKNLKLNEREFIETDNCGKTSIPGVFASGDVVTGAKTVVEAVAAAKRTANAMHYYIQSKNNKDYNGEPLYISVDFDEIESQLKK